MKRSVTLAAAATLLCALAGCTPKVEPTDYGRYLARMPRSVVVLAPLNQSTQVRAPEAFLSTVTVPLAERGYYVFPVAVVHAMLRKNGMPTSGEMHQVPPQKFREVLGADAVLYITIEEWTSRYVVLNSTTSVRLAYRLVDAASGEELWRREQTVVNSSGQGGGGGVAGVLVGAVVSAAVHAAANADGHRERQLAAQANMLVIGDAHHGMLPGARHPKFADDQRERQRAAASAVAPPVTKAPLAE